MYSKVPGKDTKKMCEKAKGERDKGKGTRGKEVRSKK